MDVAGEQQIDVVSNLVKTRRDLAGNKLGVGEYVGWGCAVSNLCLAFNVDHIAPFNLQPVSGRHTSGPGASKEGSASHPLLLAHLVELDDEHLRRKMVGKCGPCFLGHKDMEEGGGQCCNSCADVQSVFKRKGSAQAQVGRAPALPARGAAGRPGEGTFPLQKWTCTKMDLGIPSPLASVDRVAPPPQPPPFIAPRPITAAATPPLPPASLYAMGASATGYLVA